jgi:hypothetical protein
MKRRIANILENKVQTAANGTDGGEAVLAFNAYTPAMKAMNAAFKQRADYDPNTAYIYILKYAADPNVAGEMPRAKQFGFIFTDNIRPVAGKQYDQVLGHTIAHEVGHGVFHLKHTFDKAYDVPPETTDNLMDYNWGDALIKHQWDGIHDPGVVIGVFEKDEEGQLQTETVFQEIAKQITDAGENGCAFIRTTPVKGTVKGSSTAVTTISEKKTISFSSTATYTIDYLVGTYVDKKVSFSLSGSKSVTKTKKGITITAKNVQSLLEDAATELIV